MPEEKKLSEELLNYLRIRRGRSREKLMIEENTVLVLISLEITKSVST
jgi:hypothetical protein